MGQAIKYFSVAITFLLFTYYSNSQSPKLTDYSKDVCSCLDSLNGTSDTEHNFSTCYKLFLDKDSSYIFQNIIKTYGEANEETITKFTNQLGIEVSIELVNSCTTYFEFLDSIKHQQYKNINRDSLRSILNGLESIDTLKRSSKNYEYASKLYFQLREFDKAIRNAEIVLSQDSTNITALFIKASLADANGNYEEAIMLYDQVARLSHQNGIYIYSAIAKRKKNGL